MLCKDKLRREQGFFFLKTKWRQDVFQGEMRFATLTVFRDKATTLIMKRNYRIIKP
jgi:hypothetical protein